MDFLYIIIIDGKKMGLMSYLSNIPLTPYRSCNVSNLKETLKEDFVKKSTNNSLRNT